MKNNTFSCLMESIKYTYNNTNLLRTSLVHKSHGKTNNERLEYLGDSILNFIISKKLYDLFPKADEGTLSRIKANLVKKETLAEIALSLEINRYMILGKGEKKKSGEMNPSLLSNTLEAIISSIFLDCKCDIDICFNVVLAWYKPILKTLSIKNIKKDSKSMLQEYLQSIGLPVPKYNLVRTFGADHSQEFTIECKLELLNNPVKGKGCSIRVAEQEAAKKILSLIKPSRKCKTYEKK